MKNNSETTLNAKQIKLDEANEALRILKQKQQECETKKAENHAYGRQLAFTSGVVNVEALLNFRRCDMFLVADCDDINQKVKLVEEEIERRLATLKEAEACQTKQ